MFSSYAFYRIEQKTNLEIKEVRQNSIFPNKVRVTIAARAGNMYGTPGSDVQDRTTFHFKPLILWLRRIFHQLAWLSSNQKP
jgi:hypothetical protein